MSTYVGIYCNTCAEDTGCGCKAFWAKELHRVIACKQELKTIQEKAGENIETSFRPNIDFEIDPTKFVVKHIDHDMVVRDEYGYTYDEKGERL